MREKNVLLPLIPLRVFLSRCRLFPFPPFPSSGRELTDPRFPAVGVTQKLSRKKEGARLEKSVLMFLSSLSFFLSFFLFYSDSERQKSGEEGGAKKKFPPILLLILSPPSLGNNAHSPNLASSFSALRTPPPKKYLEKTPSPPIFCACP